MISERKLSNSYSSFWRIALPMGDAYIRQMNTQLRRFTPPRKVNFSPNRSALISEIGYNLFINGIQKQIVQLDHNSETAIDIAAIADKSWMYIQTLVKSASAFPRPEDEELTEGIELANRLLKYFAKHEPGVQIITSPAFRGCGLIDWCRGDVLAESNLYEVKTVERDFRLSDIKQLLVYCALNYASSQYQITSLSLINPRSGQLFTTSLEVLANAMAGQSSGKLLSFIVSFISTEQISG